ncbi:MAG: NifB/NifX family molybdenum-iron cluster-binding protein [Bacteroidetes bacterium]|jgi:predicted Fe-Mo cluster-binding NifX family protein|nr:NifB/NifX family molybdenum-iron cluster-binding protein [Bacteroidota bacterium]
MKIAVATEDGKVISQHFGRSPYFAIADVEGKAIKALTLRPNTFTHHMQGGHQHHDEPEQQGGHQHRHGDAHGHHSAAEGLKDCAVVISHGMGRKAWEDLRARGVEMIVTSETDVETAVRRYLDGQLVDEVHRLH